MSGFERSSGQEANALEPLFPDDFSPDEIDFAREMRTVFPIADEVLPPLYVSTLMDDTFATPIAPSEERTLVASVFARLLIAREPLLEKLPTLPSWSSFVETIAQVNSLGRSVLAGVGMLMAAMLFSVLLTGPAFAQGLQILLGNTGVQQVSAYPKSAQQHARGGPAQASGPSIPVQWLGPTAGDYVFLTTHYDQSEVWSKGPVVDIQYVLESPSKGARVLDLREFRVADQFAAVLQVVNVGSAAQVQVGDTPAVYVDGGWLTLQGRNGPYHAWQSGTRSALIFERDGIVYWMVADQRDGSGQSLLLDLASHLRPASAHDLTPNRLTLRTLSDELPAQLHDPVGDEVYALIPAGSSQPSGIQSLVQLESRSQLGGSGLGVQAVS